MFVLNGGSATPPFHHQVITDARKMSIDSSWAKKMSIDNQLNAKRMSLDSNVVPGEPKHEPTVDVALSDVKELVEETEISHLTGRSVCDDASPPLVLDANNTVLSLGEAQDDVYSTKRSPSRSPSLVAHDMSSRTLPKRTSISSKSSSRHGSGLVIPDSLGAAHEVFERSSEEAPIAGARDSIVSRDSIASSLSV
jgi:hypothetical protein